MERKTLCAITAVLFVTFSGSALAGGSNWRILDGVTKDLKRAQRAVSVSIDQKYGARSYTGSQHIKSLPAESTTRGQDVDYKGQNGQQRHYKSSRIDGTVQVWPGMRVGFGAGYSSDFQK